MGDVWLIWMEGATKMKCRISLMVSLAAILLLVLTVPAMAKKDDEPTCSPHALTVDRQGTYQLVIQVYGELDVYWEGNTLINLCQGSIPFGEPINNAMTFAPFEEACTFFGQVGECLPSKYVLTFEEGDHRVNMTDVDSNQHYWATYSQLEVKRNGEYFFYKEYAP